MYLFKYHRTPKVPDAIENKFCLECYRYEIKYPYINGSGPQKEKQSVPQSVYLLLFYVLRMSGSIKLTYSTLILHCKRCGHGTMGCCENQTKF